MSSVVAAAAAEGGENGSGSASASSGEDQDQGSPFSTLSGDVVEEATRVVDALRERLQRVQDEFLRIEKFANLNMMACYKILKKHDKLCPHTVCCRYYLERLHQLPWIRADHSSVFVVQMSDLFELLRGDRTRKANGKKKKASERDGAQDFVRTTRKYWVSPEDVSGVKQNIAQHLPVFLVERERVKGLVEAAAGESGDGVAPGFAGLTLPSHADSQMTNSVYLDNVHLELYHARLKKAPRAIAIRLRWYGPAPTGSVYVERKTHRESWTGEESVKERFALPAAYIVPYLQCKHTWEKEESRLRAQHAKNDRERPTSGAELKKIKTLFTEVQRAIESKQLQPTLRTVYMRTAFQVPYDASVRCSLDTSLAMLVENPAGGPSCTALERWYRDPSVPLHRTEVTRFPHAVLEIKLALGEGVAAPDWVNELVASGALTEVHKFSKFMHGCAVLFPDTAQEVPYWVDDVSLRDSLQHSASVETGAARVPRPGAGDAATGAAAAAAADARTDAGERRGSRGSDEDGELTHPLLLARDLEGRDASRHVVLDLIGDARAEAEGMREAAGRRGAGFFADVKRFFRRLPGGGAGGGRAGAGGGRAPSVPRSVPMRVEPKTFFANERTFLSWLHTAVLIGTIGAALVGVHLGGSPSGAPHKDVHGNDRSTAPLVIAMTMLSASVCLCAYATWTFVWRGRAIAARRTVAFHDPTGPVVMGAIMMCAMVVVIIVTILQYERGGDL